MALRQSFRAQRAWLTPAVFFLASCGLAWFVAPSLLAGVIGTGAPLLAIAPSLYFRRGPSIADPRTDLARRRIAWAALSELYLDTEFDADDRARLCDGLCASGYDIDQLEQILYRELHPVLLSNLLSVAGEWIAFDQDALAQRVLARRFRRARVSIVPGAWLVRNECNYSVRDVLRT
jgi:hypothetical protein